ncbi:D123-domain-containing protein [Lobosporangium transversale]|uniref:D123-domain-containing protein n=1 Tax=Lobosporangium transversale TaxID=64571 RepID=A0A1Y2GNP1_9FUNG|nr:D123-domain-containing protein [Lobosporangium transversale]ORZ15474.1 D123-domain-containing protein [Lobosporangium transversale]|eukprot:XP_021881222.1 D123-domain-containing protein [Lobosporangium transversale]
MSVYKPEDEQNQHQESQVPLEAITPRPLVFPPLTHQRLENCSFSAWYPIFRANTIKSKIIALPEDFISYLNADGVFIPGQRTFRQATTNDNDSSDDDNDDDEEIQVPLPSFPTLEREIEKTIEDLGGEVFPKLNWSSPRDASWIAPTNTLKCHNAADIFLLLKSSDFVAHDLAHAYEDCSDGAPLTTRKDHIITKKAAEVDVDADVAVGVRQRPETIELVLRKWFDLAPSMEFRCFVKGHQLVGVSQRDMTYYDFLKGIKDELEQKIIAFYEEKIRNKFPDPDYTFDVYITRNRERIYVIDFNPFAQKTDSLLFEWEELVSAKERLPLRLLASEAAGQHMKQPFAFNRYPSDVTDLSNGQTVADFAEAFYKKVQAANEK